jgi:hypothetical protein
VTDDAAFYDRALRRMSYLAIVLAAALTTWLWIRYGWANGLACAFGATISIWNLHWWKRLVARIADPATPRRPASAVFLGLRYLILGGICFVIVKFFEVSLLALIAGLLISVAAVLVEMAYELVFIR